MSRPAAVWLSRQRWLPYKTRRSVIKKLYPEMLKDYAFEADLLGSRFQGNIVNYIDRLVYFCGAHEKYMLFFLRDYVAKLKAAGAGRLAFVDVGANAGNHSVFMSRLVDEVHAFEPFERVRKQLEANLALNHITNVRVHPYGLSDKEATMPFYAGPDSNLGAASFFADHKADNKYLGDMQLKRGDDILKDAPDIAIVKADIEGFEKFALMGLQETIRRTRPLLIIELSPKTRETLGSERALESLFPERYRFYYFAYGKHDSGRYKLAPFNYARLPKIQDVIAVPEERLGCLSFLNKHQ